MHTDHNFEIINDGAAVCTRCGLIDARERPNGTEDYVIIQGYGKVVDGKLVMYDEKDAKLLPCVGGS